MFYILNSKSHEKYGVEIVELCGGRGHTSYLRIRRQMAAGHNFELVTGCVILQIAAHKPGYYRT